MYGKLFDSMYDGTLVANWEALVTFQQMIILADESGVVDITPHALAARTGIPKEIISKGIEILLAPDEYSRSPEQDGRRIECLDDHRPWGWTIVNYKKYRDLNSREEKKRKDRERIAAKREAQRVNENAVVASCREVSQVVADVAHTDTDTDISSPTVTPEFELSSNSTEQTPRKIIPYEKIRIEFNANCTKQPQCVKMTDSRKRLVKKLVDRHGMDTMAKWRNYFFACSQDQFISEIYGNGNGAPIDYVLREDVMVRVYENGLGGAADVG